MNCEPHFLLVGDSRDLPAISGMLARRALGDDPHPYIIWIGCSMSAPVTRLYRRLAERLGAAHLHHPHHP